MSPPRQMPSSSARRLIARPVRLDRFPRYGETALDYGIGDVDPIHNAQHRRAVGRHRLARLATDRPTPHQTAERPCRLAPARPGCPVELALLIEQWRDNAEQVKLPTIDHQRIAIDGARLALDGGGSRRCQRDPAQDQNASQDRETTASKGMDHDPDRRGSANGGQGRRPRPARLTEALLARAMHSNPRPTRAPGNTSSRPSCQAGKWPKEPRYEHVGSRSYHWPGFIFLANLR